MSIEEREERKKKKGKARRRGSRLPERGRFLVQELYKLRRLTAEQVGELLRCPGGSWAPIRLARRIERLGFFGRQTTYVRARAIDLFRLTDMGRQQAASALGRDYAPSIHDDLDAEFIDHLMMGTELYLRIVTEGCGDWIDVRNRASMFAWFSSNEHTQFSWEEYGAERQRVSRKVIPDITIETETARYLVEIERSTKTQRGVERKVEKYTKLFSPLRALGGGVSPYVEKYPDARKPVLVLVFESEDRAAEVARRIEKRSTQRFFNIPAWRCGTLASIAPWLRQELCGATPAVKTDDVGRVLARYEDVVLRFIGETTGVLRDLRTAEQRGERLVAPKDPDSLPKIAELVGELRRLRRPEASR
ncbi:MAG: replication-relaxation family protein [Deltaproteobacteria bacterium]|nr:replication-relaxation family protein [Deltaproteobacteria bacterium]